MKESNTEVKIDLTFNLLALVLLVAAMVQYFYTDHAYMALVTAVAVLIWFIVIVIKYSKK